MTTNWRHVLYALTQGHVPKTDEDVINIALELTSVVNCIQWLNAPDDCRRCLARHAYASLMTTPCYTKNWDKLLCQYSYMQIVLNVFSTAEPPFEGVDRDLILKTYQHVFLRWAEQEAAPAPVILPPPAPVEAPTGLAVKSIQKYEEPRAVTSREIKIAVVSSEVRHVQIKRWAAEFPQLAVEFFDNRYVHKVKLGGNTFALVLIDTSSISHKTLKAAMLSFEHCAKNSARLTHPTFTEIIKTLVN